MEGAETQTDRRGHEIKGKRESIDSRFCVAVLIILQVKHKPEPLAYRHKVRIWGKWWE